MTFPLVLVAAVIISKRYRWWVLYIAPIVAMLPCVLFGGDIAYNGNLLFAVIFGFAVIGWVVYYMVLVVWCVVRWVMAASTRPSQPDLPTS